MTVLGMEGGNLELVKVLGEVQQYDIKAKHHKADSNKSMPQQRAHSTFIRVQPNSAINSSLRRSTTSYGGRQNSFSQSALNSTHGNLFHALKESELTFNQKLLFLYHNLIFDPQSTFILRWHYTIVLLCIYFLIELPLDLAFSATVNERVIEPYGGVGTVNLLIDIFFMLDILLTFRTAYHRDLDQIHLIVDPAHIAKHYLQRWFAVDLISSIPLDHMVYAALITSDSTTQTIIGDNGYRAYNTIYVVCRVLRLLKLIRYNHLFAIIGQLELRAGLVGEIVKAVKFVAYFFLTAHVGACIFVAIGLKESHGLGNSALDDDGDPIIVFATNSWFVRTGNVDTTTLDSAAIYVMALYWSFMTITTVGYGDITPISIAEVVYTCGIVFVGAIAFGYIIGNVSTIIAAEDETSRRIRDRITSINEWMRYRRLPITLQRKIRSHYEYAWKKKTIYDERDILTQLPTFLRTRVSLYLHQHLIKQIPFLRDIGPDCLSLLLSELTPFQVEKDTTIFQIGSLGREMYFILEGAMELIGKRGQTIAILEKGAYFGEFAILADRPTRRSATVKSIVLTDLLILTKESFDTIAKVFPELREVVEQKAEQTLIAAAERQKKQKEESAANGANGKHQRTKTFMRSSLRPANGSGAIDDILLQQHPTGTLQQQLLSPTNLSSDAAELEADAAAVAATSPVGSLITDEVVEQIPLQHTASKRMSLFKSRRSSRAADDEAVVADASAADATAIVDGSLAVPTMKSPKLGLSTVVRLGKLRKKLNARKTIVPNGTGTVTLGAGFNPFNDLNEGHGRGDLVAEAVVRHHEAAKAAAIAMAEEERSPPGNLERRVDRSYSLVAPTIDSASHRRTSSNSRMRIATSAYRPPSLDVETPKQRTFNLDAPAALSPIGSLRGVLRHSGSVRVPTAANSIAGSPALSRVPTRERPPHWEQPASPSVKRLPLSMTMHAGNTQQSLIDHSTASLRVVKSNSPSYTHLVRSITVDVGDGNGAVPTNPHMGTPEGLRRRKSLLTPHPASPKSPKSSKSTDAG